MGVESLLSQRSNLQSDVDDVVQTTARLPFRYSTVSLS